MTSDVTTRAKTAVWMVGTPNASLPEHQLPTIGDVLTVFFHKHVDENLTVEESAKRTVDDVMKLWSKASVPTVAAQNAKIQLVRLYQQWRTLSKGKKRRGPAQLNREESFCGKRDDLFDIAHCRATELIQIKEDLDFLLDQSQGRTQVMGKQDRKYSKTLLTKAERSADGTLKASAADAQEIVVSSEECSKDEEDAALVASAASASSTEETIPEANGIVSTAVASALDRTGTSDRNALHILGAAAVAMKGGVSEVTLSRSTIRRRRIEVRKKLATNIRESFSTTAPMVVHWDSKLLPTPKSNKKVERLAIIATGGGTEKLLGTPIIPSSSGEDQATAVANELHYWNLADRVCAKCYDTTASNTGAHKGACILLEQKLGRRLMDLPCRHHIHELVIASAFSALKIAPSTGPDVLLFQRFRSDWEEIDQSRFSCSTDDPELTRRLADCRASIETILMKFLSESQPRDDYRELLELTLLFLGGSLPGGATFRAPGALHRARFMAKLIYSFKIWMFRGQFKLTKREENGLRELCMFAAKLYVKNWFESPISTKAPANDLQLLHDIMAYDNATISEAATKTLRRHLWYLSEINVGFAFFDQRLSDNEKACMATNMHEVTGTDNPPRKFAMDSHNYSHDISSYVTTNTRSFFEALAIDCDEFLALPPSEWGSDSTYAAAREIVMQTQVVNDCAERGVKLITDYCCSLTADEEQRAYLLQTVELNRRQFPQANKSNFTGKSN